ncbi:MAG: hypothetical protein WCV62_02600 [Candidatus Peribacteraceae bacterium]|jgi:hypothetical protein
MGILDFFGKDAISDMDETGVVVNSKGKAIPAGVPRIQNTQYLNSTPLKLSFSDILTIALLIVCAYWLLSYVIEELPSTLNPSDLELTQGELPIARFIGGLVIPLLPTLFFLFILWRSIKKKRRQKIRTAD